MFLDQTYQDFEIVITDDGSSDNSAEVIKSIVDKRIKLEVFPTNRGACVAGNHSILKSSGRYIAILNSDDAWEPSKLEKQVNYLDYHPEIGAVFTKVNFIDESNRPFVNKNYKYIHVFDVENRTRYAWLKRFFYQGNCLCHPSILIRKKCYDEIGLYDERMANLPDLDMWVRLCLKYEIHIMDEKLIRFRILKNAANASGDNPTTNIRSRFEFKQILDHFLTINDKQELPAIFPEASRYGTVENEFIPYFLGRLALDVNNGSTNLWGLEVLYKFMGNETMCNELENRYNFRYLDFLKLTARYDVLRDSSNFSRLSNTNPGRNIFLRSAIRLHWALANLAKKYILK